MHIITGKKDLKMSLAQTEPWSAVVPCFSVEPYPQDTRDGILALRHVK